MSCKFCTDPDGAACFPIYGVGPHRHVGVTENPLSLMESTVFLPQSEWPTNYRDNPEEPGHGVWWCPHCGDGKPEDAPLGVPIAPEWRDHLEKLSEEAQEWQKRQDRSIEELAADAVKQFREIRAREKELGPQERHLVRLCHRHSDAALRNAFDVVAHFASVAAAHRQISDSNKVLEGVRQKYAIFRREVKGDGNE